MANSYYQSAYKGTEIDESIGKVQDIFIKKTAAIPVDVGGTGQTTIQGIKDMLGIGEDQQGVTPVANGGTGATTATDARTNLGVPPTAHASTATTYGAASASSYGHAMASSTTPKVAGTATVGSETAKFARGDHVHPAQTSVTGNAGSATKLATARTIRTNLGSTSTASFDGTANITPGVTGTLPVSNGGTGATTAADARTNLGITPANIGAVKTTGDTMTGDLSLKMNNPHLYMTDTTNAETNSRGTIAHGTREMQMIAYSQVGSTQNFRGLFVADAVKTPDVAQALRLSDRVNGASTYYNVLTEANAKDIISEQVAPADIGALSTTGTAAAATKLATARTIQTNLSSTSTASFDGTANVTPGVTGTLPISNGGTGATTAADARTNLGITPANIGAVKTTGDTMTGDLSISSTYPKIYLTDTDEESQGSVIHSDRRTQMFAYNEAGSTLDSRGIIVDAASKTSDVADALVLADRVNGITTYYNVLTEANAKDIVQELLQGGELSVVKSVQRGIIELTGNHGGATLASSVDVSKSIVIYGGHYRTIQAENPQANISLTSSTRVDVNGVGSMASPCDVPYQVIEFY